MLKIDYKKVFISMSFLIDITNRKDPVIIEGM